MYLAYIYLVIKNAGRLLITRCNLLRICSQKLKAQRGGAVCTRYRKGHGFKVTLTSFPGFS